MLRNLDGRIDCILFCHGVINFMGGIDGNLPEWDSVMKINVRSTMHIMSVMMPFLRMKKGNGSVTDPAGSVTVLSSSAGEKPWPGHTIYNSCMASLNMLVRVAALENAHHGVRINAVAPGYVRSKNARSNQNFQNPLDEKQNEGIINEAAMNTPLLGLRNDTGRPEDAQYVYQVQEPVDVAMQMLWLATDEASFMNGEVMVIDGGLTNTTNGFEQYVAQAEQADRLLANQDQ